MILWDYLALGAEFRDRIKPESHELNVVEILFWIRKETHLQKYIQSIHSPQGLSQYQNKGMPSLLSS